MLADDGGCELWVLDGEVEINLPGKAEPILVKSGYKYTFSETGPSCPPSSIPLTAGEKNDDPLIVGFSLLDNDRRSGICCHQINMFPAA